MMDPVSGRTIHGHMLILAVAFFLQTLIVVIGYVTRDAIFLLSFEKHELANIVICGSMLSYCTSEAYNWATRGVRADIAALYVALLISVTFTLLHAARDKLATRHWASLVYLIVEVFAALAVHSFWEIASGAFNAKESKNYFGFIGMGGTLANLFVGFVLMETLSRYNIPTHDNLLLIAGVGLALALVLLLWRMQVASKHQGKHHTNSKTGAGASRLMIA